LCVENGYSVEYSKMAEFDGQTGVNKKSSGELRNCLPLPFADSIHLLVMRGCDGHFDVVIMAP